MNTKTKTSAAPAERVLIRPTMRDALWFQLVGKSALLMNAFNQKSIEQMLKKHMQHAVQREAKKPRDLIERAIVRNEEGTVCMPAVAFKKAMLTAVAGVKGLNKPKARLAFDVVGFSIPISFDKMVPRMDVVRNANGQPDVRFRPSFPSWRCQLGVEYDPNRISGEAVMTLVGDAGRAVGIGEWRPERDGKMGTWEIEDLLPPREHARAKASCMSPIQAPAIPEWAMDLDVDLEQLLSPAADGSPGGTAEAPVRAAKSLGRK